MATDISIWALLFYFVFETRAVVDMVKSGSHIEYQKSKQMTRRLKIGYLALSTTLSILYHIVAGIRLVDRAAYTTHEGMLKWMSVASRILYISLFAVLAYHWLTLAVFFIKKKGEKLRREKKNFSRFNKQIIVWTFILSSLLILHHFNLIICGALELLVSD